MPWLAGTATEISTQAEERQADAAGASALTGRASPGARWRTRPTTNTVQRPAPALVEQVRVDFGFDLLALDDDILLDEPYTSRRAELADLRIDDGARVRVPPTWPLADHDAEQLLHTAAQVGCGSASTPSLTKDEIVATFARLTAQRLQTIADKGTS